MGRSKQFWSMEETKCLLEIWSSSEIQKQLEGASRSKEVYEAIQIQLAAQGYDRELEQIINKIKKLKKEYREQKHDTYRSTDYWVKRNPHFEVLESVLSSRAAGQSVEPENNTVVQTFPDLEIGKCRQMWSVLETNCLLKIWSSVEAQKKTDGPTRAREMFEDIQREMAAEGYVRTLEQIMYKCKQLKKEYSAQKNNPGQCKNLWTNIHFEILDSVFGDTAACQQSVPQISATVKIEPTEDLTESYSDSGLSTTDDANTLFVLPGPHDCAASEKMEPTEDTMLQFYMNPVLSSSDDLNSECVVPKPQDRSSCSSSSPQPSQGKRKREDSSEYLAQCLEYLERLHERNLQHSRDMHEALLNKLDTHMTALLGHMGRMVAAMEAQARKQSL